MTDDTKPWCACAPNLCAYHKRIAAQEDPWIWYFECRDEIAFVGAGTTNLKIEPPNEEDIAALRELLRRWAGGKLGTRALWGEADKLIKDYEARHTVKLPSGSREPIKLGRCIKHDVTQPCLSCFVDANEGKTNLPRFAFPDAKPEVPYAPDGSGTDAITEAVESLKKEKP